MAASNSITVGSRFGLLTVSELTEIPQGKILPLYRCVCDCGAVVIKTRRHLVHDEIRSCGCLAKARTREVHRRHDHASRGGKSKLYRTWRSMMQRCYRVREKGYKHYGARGIKVCDRWHDFANFLADMGDAPEGMSLDRIDNAKGYSPDNCRWATRVQQARNTRLTRMVTYNGVTKALGDWADEIGIARGTLQRRLSIGWPIEKALYTKPLSIKERSAMGLNKRWGSR